jgi:two-component system OmpR family response regulator
MEIALGGYYEGYERSIDTHISNLRKKIEPDPAQPRFIVTAHGLGYKFGKG